MSDAFADQPKYYVFQLVKHSEAFFKQTVEEEIESQNAINDFFLSWHPRIKQVIGAHAVNLAGEWDWLGVFAVEELSEWEACREEYKRLYPGRVDKSLSLPGVSHKEFIRATENVQHYMDLRAADVFPGGAETTPK